MIPIRFLPNEPQVLALKESSGTMDGFNVLYETTDGRLVSLPRPAAELLGRVDPAPAEEIQITRVQAGKSPSEWVIALTARSEKLRAEKEAAELAEKTKRDLATQLQASVLRQMPKSANSSCQEPSEAPRGTGTYGPVPQAAPASRKAQIPFNLAFREVVAFVTKELNDSGEQWSEQSRQDLTSTVLIAAAKAGYVGVWER
jgi:hypothetical protein